MQHLNSFLDSGSDLYTRYNREVNHAKEMVSQGFSTRWEQALVISHYTLVIPLVILGASWTCQALRSLTGRVCKGGQNPELDGRTQRAARRVFNSPVAAPVQQWVLGEESSISPEVRRYVEATLDQDLDAILEAIDQLPAAEINQTIEYRHMGMNFAAYSLAHHATVSLPREMALAVLERFEQRGADFDTPCWNGYAEVRTSDFLRAV